MGESKTKPVFGDSDTISTPVCEQSVMSGATLSGYSTMFYKDNAKENNLLD